jgi:hypothetical protein
MPLFYRAAVQAVFNQAETEERDLRDLIAARLRGRDASEAHTPLAGLYLRTGR